MILLFNIDIYRRLRILTQKEEVVLISSSNGLIILAISASTRALISSKLRLFNKVVTTHTFRHTHISLLAEKQTPLKTIMARVGHNEPKTTLSIYTHVTDAMKEQEKQILDSIDIMA